MVILITGASHTGKTVLAQKMLERYKYTYLSVDHLKMGLIRSGNTELTPMDDDKLTDYLWPIEREMIKTAIENKQNMVVEGCYVPFDWRKDFEEEYLSEIRFICLALSDTYIDSHFDAITSHASDVENRMDDSDCTKEWLMKCNREFIEGFRNAGEEVTLIESDYEKTIEDLCPDQDAKGGSAELVCDVPFMEHVALFVNDVEKGRDFFVKYLGGVSNSGYHNKNTGFRSYFITFGNGARLEVMSKPGVLDPSKERERTGYEHIAFSVGSKERVDELTKILTENGYEVLRGPRTTGDGYYESCIVGIEGNHIEITV